MNLKESKMVQIEGFVVRKGKGKGCNYINLKDKRNKSQCQLILGTVKVNGLEKLQGL